MIEQYKHDIEQWDWKGILNETYRNVEEINGELFGQCWLGKVHRLVPSGKYYTPWACSNVTEQEAERDRLWYTALELVAEHYDLTIEAGRGDPTDVYATNYLGIPTREGVEMYHQISEFLGESQEEKIRYKTHAVRLAYDLVGIRHHETIILTYEENGACVMDCDGWRSSTTKERLNVWLPEGYGVYQENHVWYLYTPDGETHVYQDGILIAADGSVHFQRASDDDLKALAAEVRDYAADFAQAVLDGKVKWDPDQVCKPCRDWRPQQEPLPATVFQGHLRYHVREQEFVPSLVFATKRTYRLSKLGDEMVTDVVLHGLQWDDPWLKEVVQQELTSALRRTLYRALGLGL